MPDAPMTAGQAARLIALLEIALVKMAPPPTAEARDALRETAGSALLASLLPVVSAAIGDLPWSVRQLIEEFGVADAELGSDLVSILGRAPSHGSIGKMLGHAASGEREFNGYRVKLFDHKRGARRWHVIGR